MKGVSKKWFETIRRSLYEICLYNNFPRASCVITRRSINGMTVMTWSASRPLDFLSRVLR